MSHPLSIGHSLHFMSTVCRSLNNESILCAPGPPGSIIRHGLRTFYFYHYHHHVQKTVFFHKPSDSVDSVLTVRTDIFIHSGMYSQSYILISSCYNRTSHD